MENNNLNFVKPGSGNGNSGERKGGALGWLSSLFRGGASASGSAGGLGAKTGLAALFSSKAGIMGALLGGATIAAGIGVVYNFMGPSSAPVYSPGLFQNKYYESLTEQAEKERLAALAAKNQGMSSTDALRQGIAQEPAPAAAASPDAATAADSGKADGLVSREGEASADANPGANGNASGELAAAGSASKPSLQKNGSGFGGSGKLSGGSGIGMSNMGASMAAMKTPSTASTGKSSAMAGQSRASVRTAQRMVARASGRNALGQLKGLSSAQRNATSLESAQEATSMTYDGGGATGLQTASPIGVGAGVASAGTGTNVPASQNPSTSAVTPAVPDASSTASDVTPWKKWSNMAMYGLMVAAILVALANKFAKSPMTWSIAKVLAGLAMAAAAMVILAGVKLLGYGQKMQGIMYSAIGALIEFQAIKAMQGASEDSLTNVADQKLVNPTDQQALKAFNASTDSVNGILVKNSVGEYFVKTGSTYTPFK